MGAGKFPAMKVSVVKRIVERHCGPPKRIKGSHHFYTGPSGQRILLVVHTKEMPGMYVRDILVAQLGLSEEDALGEVGAV